MIALCFYLTRAEEFGYPLERGGLIEKIRKWGILARLSSRNYTPVPPDHDLPARGKSHPINFWYGSR